MSMNIYNANTGKLEQISGYQPSVDKVEVGNMNPVTSNAVANALTNDVKINIKSIYNVPIPSDGTLQTLVELDAEKGMYIIEGTTTNSDFSLPKAERVYLYKNNTEIALKDIPNNLDTITSFVGVETPSKIILRIRGWGNGMRYNGRLRILKIK